MFRITLCAALALSLPALACAQDEARIEQVHFARGASGTELKGSIKGYESVDYQLDAQAGQTMTVTQTAGKAYFNIIEPNADGAAIFVGSSDGKNFKGLLKQSGTYTIRVYQMRNTARRGESAGYTLHVDVP